MRLARSDDALFIVEARTDTKNQRFIHQTDPSVEKQLTWLEEYYEKEKNAVEYYFVIESEHKPYGLFRIYDIYENNFTSGSWVFKHNAPQTLATASNILGRLFAYQYLDKEIGYFDVKKANHPVLTYNQLFKPTVIRETHDTVYFELDRETFQNNAKRVARFCGLRLPSDSSEYVIKL